MRIASILLTVLLLGACSGGGGDSGSTCAGSLDCDRGLVCVDGACKEVDCTGHADCAKYYAGTFCWTDIGKCAAIECKEGVPGQCAEGFECFKFLCIEMAPECTTSAQCKQPVEKCLNNHCVPANYCDSDDDCPSNECNIEEATCVKAAQPDVIDELDVVVPDIQECDPEEFTDPVSFLCASCQVDEQCGCGQGVCVDIGEEKGCSIECGEETHCPAGYLCQDGYCKPQGGACKGCIPPPGCEDKDETCDFKTGECVPEIDWCGTCKFDYECGFGNRCHLGKDGAVFCAPECDPENFSCPLGSGCEVRDDGLMVCVYNGADCCYGIDCEKECFCEPPTPYCNQDNECVQCLDSSHCPGGKPVCDAQTQTCIIQCVAPTPIYWKDPDSGLEYCVECLKSLDCAPGMLCGTFKNELETYHKCYNP